MDYDYVSLHRRFLDIGTSDPDDDRLAAFRSSSRAQPDGKTWEEIETNDGSVILGSAGSGKTTEVLEAAKRLRQNGIPAFVLRLEALCRQPVQQSFSPLDPDGEKAFNRWRGSNKSAVVFLDALDEARLPEALNESVLNDAFGQLWNAVGIWGRELRIVITTRASEWHGPSDFRIVTQFLKKLRANPDEKYEPKAAVYRLAPLQQVDVELLAVSRLGEAEKFLQAIGKARAGTLASQPFEVHILIDTWLYELSRGVAHNQVFASRLALFETAISTRLQTEQGQERRSNLDPKGAREACEKLAAATVLTGIRDISVRQGAPFAVDALAVLTNGVEPWSEIEVRQLLSSALFQPSVGGKIRFAHRELQDFLAAKFFDRQMRENAGALEIIAPLFAESYGSTFVPQETEHVLGWLATLNRGARTKIISIRPSLLIEAGDPLLLSDEERGAALEAHVAQYSDRRYRGEWFSAEDISKFAIPELAPTVGRLLDNSASSEVREFLVEVARYGKMTSLADNLASIAKSVSEAPRVRAEANLALKEFGDTIHVHDVFQSSLYAVPPDDIHEAPSWNLFQISALQYAFPNYTTILDAIIAISRLRREASNYASMTSVLLEEFARTIPENATSDWLTILLRFAAGARSEEQYRLPTVVPQFRVLKDSIIRLAIRLLRQVDWQNHQEVLLDALEYLFNRGDHFSVGRSPHDELLDLIVPNIELKRALIDRRLQLFPTPAEKPLQVFPVIEGMQLRDNQAKRSVFSIADVASYSADVGSLRSSKDRRVAFEIAEDIAYRLPWDENREAIRILVKAARKSGDAELRARVQSGAKNWLLGKWYRFRHHHQYKLRRWAQSRVDHIFDLRWRAQNFFSFAKKRKSLRSGHDADVLVWAVRRAPKELGDGALNFVRENYGPIIEGWFSDGYRAFWRQHTLAHDERSSYLAYVGLTGLAIDAKRGPISGTEEEISNALEYGLCNLNSTPPWFVDVAIANRAVFLDVARRAISDEFKAGAADSTSPATSLRMMVDADPRLRGDIAVYLLDQLKAGTSISSENLKLSLRVIALSKSIDAVTAGDFLENGFKAAFVRFDFALSWIWLDALFLVDATQAWNSLVSVVGDDWDAAALSVFREFLGREMRRGGRSRDESHDRDDLSGNAHALARLIRTTYLAWPPNRDPIHEAVYSPRPADRATDRRRYYVAMLGRAGEAALKEFDWLITHPLLAAHSESFKYEKDQMIRLAARRPIYSAPHAIVFLDEFSKAPETVAEFRAMVRRHLRALLYKLHLSDDDESYVFRRGNATEDDLRNWLAGRMRDIGDRYYTVIREQEVAIENRPDLRVHARKPGLGNVSIEIKLADETHWSGRILRDKLKTQLTDQYMHEFQSHSGIYLLANAARPKVVEYDKKGNLLRQAFSKKIDSKKYDFSSLIALLVEDAKLLCNSERHVEVMAIDLSER